mmetsp:Transcript_17892/g.51270  ORF Transcript_17892/g.51270 Transcript_17892/m.51270 type:complete len:280 (+) Transcript_17892:1126-1965(+)
MGVRSGDGDAEPLARLDVGGAVESAEVGILGGREAAVGTLGPPEAELDELGEPGEPGELGGLGPRARHRHRQAPLAEAAEAAEAGAGAHAPGGHDHPGGVGGDEARVVDEAQQGRFHELGDAQRPLHDEHRDAGEAQRSLPGGHHPDVGAGQAGQILVEEGRLAVRQGGAVPQVVQIGRREAEVDQELEHLVQAGQDGVLPAERILPEEQLEHRRVGVPAGLPVRVGHGQLIQVGEKRSDQGIGRRGDADAPVAAPRPGGVVGVDGGGGVHRDDALLLL